MKEFKWNSSTTTISVVDHPVDPYIFTFKPNHPVSYSFIHIRKILAFEVVSIQIRMRWTADHQVVDRWFSELGLEIISLLDSATTGTSPSKNSTDPNKKEVGGSGTRTFGVVSCESKRELLMFFKVL